MFRSYAGSLQPAPGARELLMKLRSDGIKTGEDARVAIMIGDTPYDVEAALRAGVPIIAVRCGGIWGDRDFRGSFSIFDDPGDILVHYEILGAALTLQPEEEDSAA